MILLNSYFENERDLWGEHVFCKDLARDEDFAHFVFSPVIARGSIAFNNSVGFTLKTLGFPDLRWPFNNDPKIYNYATLKNLPNVLNDDVILYNSYHTLSAFNLNKKLWIRSAPGNKILTGAVFTRDEFEQELEYLKQVNSDDVCFAIASPKEIHKEYRCIFIDGTFVSGSLYMKDGEPSQDEDVPLSLQQQTQSWFDAQCILPKHIVVDITDQGKIIEVNNLLTSGWYSADLEKIIDRINAICRKITKIS